MSEWFVVWPHPEGEAHEFIRFDDKRAAATWFIREACQHGAIRMYPAEQERGETPLRAP